LPAPSFVSNNPLSVNVTLEDPPEAITHLISCIPSQNAITCSCVFSPSNISVLPVKNIDVGPLI
jgi:hypothetical protein